MPDLFCDDPIPIEAQIRCVAREIGFRETVYPRQVAAGRMTQAKADRELATMRAVLETLLAVKAHA